VLLLGILLSYRSKWVENCWAMDRNEKRKGKGLRMLGNTRGEVN